MFLFERELAAMLVLFLGTTLQFAKKKAPKHKIIAKKLGSYRNTSYLCTQMRVAYRRDNIKLRNRRFNKAEGRAPTALIRL